MSVQNITNLKRQISRRSVNGADMALKDCQSWHYGFKTTSTSGRDGVLYSLLCAGRIVGSFTYFAKGSRPEYAPGVWAKSGAERPWIDEEKECGENVI